MDFYHRRRASFDDIEMECDEADSYMEQERFRP